MLQNHDDTLHEGDMLILLSFETVRETLMWAHLAFCTERAKMLLSFFTLWPLRRYRTARCGIHNRSNCDDQGFHEVARAALFP